MNQALNTQVSKRTIVYMNKERRKELSVVALCAVSYFFTGHKKCPQYVRKFTYHLLTLEVL